MQQISFGSTYRINLYGIGMTNQKRASLKKFVSNYQNYLYPNKEGFVRLSVRKRNDEKVEAALARMGIKEYQIFSAHNVPKAEIEGSNRTMDSYIKTQLGKREYTQRGKQKKSI